MLLPAVLVGCGGGVRVLTPGCLDAIDPDDFSQSCPDDDRDVVPGESLSLEFAPYAYGTYADTYTIAIDAAFDPDATLSATEVELDGTPVPVTLEVTLPADACGAEFAGIDITSADGTHTSGASVLLSVTDGAGSPLFCGG
jgi:hypothetical protein